MQLNYRITLSLLLLVCIVGIVVCDDDQDHQQEPLNRGYSEEDEGSCICGLNKDILDKIESIVKSSQSQCHLGGSINSGGSNWQQHLGGGSRPDSSNSQSGSASSSNSNSNDNNDSPNSSSKDPSNESARPSTDGGAHDNNQGQSGSNHLEDEIKDLQNQIAQLMQLSNQNNGGQSKQPSTSSSDSWTPPSARPQSSQSGYNQIERPPNQAENNQNNVGGSSSNTNDHNQMNYGRPNSSGYNQNGYGGSPNSNNNNNNNAGYGGYDGNNNQVGGRPNQNDNYSGNNNWQQHGRPNTNSNSNNNNNNNDNNNQPNSDYNDDNNRDNNQGGAGGNNGPVHEDPKDSEPINAGFLGGLPPPSSSSGVENEALNKLNQSQKVDTSDMQNALELTIPNVVSNIFSNIQNLTIQTGHQRPNGDDGGSNGNKPIQSLTSIDGSSASVSGSSTEQITAIGEQLFIEWIDHQLATLHLTASMAAYIQRNALSLFRRIVKQYVERVERMGGKVEDNVRRATQIALSNTQNLISFLLKNYLNFAGGIMKILGEQVSRVGKQLDSTGETIANINLNPFDIVSNVIDSLPNPSHYSEYFRAFGKYLMGESKGEQQQQQQQHQNDQPQQTTNENSNNNNQDQRPKGLFSKTMGALSKTLGSWIG